MVILRHHTVDLHIDTNALCDPDNFLAGIRFVLRRNLLPERFEAILPQIQELWFFLAGKALRQILAGGKQTVTHFVVHPHFGSQDLLLPRDLRHVFRHPLDLRYHISEYSDISKIDGEVGQNALLGLQYG